MLRQILLILFAASAFAAEERPLDTSIPISQLFSLTIRDVYGPSQWNSDQKLNSVEFRPLVPFYLGHQLNIMRLSVPYRTSWPSGAGLGDVRLFDLLALPTQHTLYGIGPVVNLRANVPPGTDTLQAGFVVGMIAFTPRWAFGLLNQNLFSKNVRASTFQPVLIYSLSEEWTLGLGELPFILNWKSASAVFIPVGFQIGFQPGAPESAPRIFFNPQYNTKNISNAPQWTITTGVTLPISFPHPKQAGLTELHPNH